MENLPDEIKEIFEKFDLCLLCKSEEVEFNGIFFPKDSTQFGASPEVDRLIFYKLCRACYEMKDKIEAVELECKRNIEQMIIYSKLK